MTRDGGRAFLRALERFQDVKSLFLQLHGPGLDRTHPEISTSPEIFGEDCEIQVTLHRLWEIYGFADIWMYILENKITICLQDVVINTALNDH